ncbi:hypothetical protein NDI76_12235 [Halogeometricum sp. S1BR25-6]|uniref:Small CPxCG-related zinc finger protein n=1 Tax=Halogeometricum salsisoli TaxID=2950536 RepID=A0ABU2GGF9_9EURY|nr:hypothetical protein [Halogeometricum sp. S1BR25-6]MDS0299511.1 hypothetical protein [Halogeometricum sp. S1BR25-6]
MEMSVVACPHCGQQVEATHPTGVSTRGVRRRLKSEYRATRNTCPECGSQYDIRAP